MKTNFNKNQKGQVLLSVVVAMTVALSVGIAVSSRTLSMSSRVTRADTSSRLIAAVEGGLEHVLAQPDSVLDELSKSIDHTNLCKDMGLKVNDPDDGCHVAFQPSRDDKITVVSHMTVSKFRSNEPSGENEHYWFMMNQGDTKEVVLDGYGKNEVTICWNNQDAALYYIVYGDEGEVSKGGLVPDGGPSDLTGFDSVSKGGNGYNYCEKITLDEGEAKNPADPFGLRIKALYDSSKVAVFPTDPLPYQGYKIVVTGELSGPSAEKVVKKIRVYRSFPYMPAIFDFAIYTNSAL